MLKEHRVRTRRKEFLTPAARHSEAMLDVGPGAFRPQRREVDLTRLLRDDDARGKTAAGLLRVLLTDQEDLQARGAGRPHRGPQPPPITAGCDCRPLRPSWSRAA